MPWMSPATSMCVRRALCCGVAVDVAAGPSSPPPPHPARRRASTVKPRASRATLITLTAREPRTRSTRLQLRSGVIRLKEQPHSAGLERRAVGDAQPDEVAGVVEQPPAG